MGVAEGQGQGRRKQVRQASLRQNVQCPRQVQLQKKKGQGWTSHLHQQQYFIPIPLLLLF